MKIIKYIIVLCIATLAYPPLTAQNKKQITEDVFRDKIDGFWLGQLVGNYVGFPFENIYDKEPIPILIDRYYNIKDLDSLDIRMNDNDRRSHTDIMADALGGSWSDDDTDIEFVTLHAVEKYGLDLSYEEIAGMWKKHINRYIWAANRKARDLMEDGMLPPATGNKSNNEFWYRITSQLVNEIWSAFYPGMIGKAQERALWGAHIMCDDWATHATQAYAVMYSAAFFESDVNVLVQMAAEAIPSDSPYKEGMLDVIQWHKENPNWRDVRTKIHEKYYEKVGDFIVPRDSRYVCSTVNGLCGVMAILYGQGDFTKTVAIATSAGYDCDNQAATCGGLLGVINGGASIPEKFTLELPSRNNWTKPFNDQYINYARDGLPNYNTNSDIVQRIMDVAEKAIIDNGGAKKEMGGKTIFEINTDF